MRYWLVRITSGRLMAVALAANGVAMSLAVRASTTPDVLPSASAAHYLGALSWLWGMVIGGLAFVDDVRGGHGAVVASKGDMAAHAVGAVSVGSMASLVVTAPALMGLGIADAASPQDVAWGSAAVLSSAIAMVGLGLVGASVAALAGVWGSSRGSAAAVALGGLLIAEVAAPLWLRPSTAVDLSYVPVRTAVGLLGVGVALVPLVASATRAPAFRARL